MFWWTFCRSSCCIVGWPELPPEESGSGAAAARPGSTDPASRRRRRRPTTTSKITSASSDRTSPHCCCFLVESTKIFLKHDNWGKTEAKATQDGSSRFKWNVELSLPSCRWPSKPSESTKSVKQSLFWSRFAWLWDQMFRTRQFPLSEEWFKILTSAINSKKLGTSVPLEWLVFLGSGSSG